MADGIVGEVLAVDASFGFAFSTDPAHRLLDPALGGGALLDLGIYTVNTAVQLLGPPDDVVATAQLGETGVDINTAVALRFPGGSIATAQCSLIANLDSTARVVGTEGWIDVPSPQHCAESLTVHRVAPRLARNRVEELDLPTGGHGLRYQVHEVHRCLRRGTQHSDVMSWQHTLDLMAILDRARAHIGLEYPSIDPCCSTSSYRRLRTLQRQLAPRRTRGDRSILW